MKFARSYVVELQHDDSENVLCCEHGPALLFRRLDTKNCARPFYACSFYKQSKDCSFFIWKYQTDQVGYSFQWDAVKQRVLPAWTHEQAHARFSKLLSCEPSERYICCRSLLTKEEMKRHSRYLFKNPLSDDELRRPSRLVHAHVNAMEAQFFDASCVSFVVDTLSRLDFDRVVCVGTPTLHEYIREHRPSMDSLLLDIEQSYEQFYGPDEFSWFNMFNNFHFRGAASETALRNSLPSGTRCALLVDPPFNGLLGAVAWTIERIVEGATTQGCRLNVFWFSPCFNEKRIVAAVPRLRMLDYAVHYENHAACNASSGNRTNGSLVRIFTDVPLGQIPLPEEDYAFCAQCDRWAARHNRHCVPCNDCPSNDGGPYRHCDRCGLCVEEASEHCPTCDRCLPAGHNCHSPASSAGCLATKARSASSK